MASSREAQAPPRPMRIAEGEDMGRLIPGVGTEAKTLTKADVVKVRPRDLKPGSAVRVHGREKDGTLLVEYLPYNAPDWHEIAEQRRQSINTQAEGIESFTASCSTVLEVLGTTIPQVGIESAMVLRARFGVVEDILNGVIERVRQ